MFSYFPTRIKDSLNSLIKNKINISEIRIRLNQRIKVLHESKLYYLTYNGLTFDKKNGIVVNQDDLSYIISKLTHNSLYVFYDKLNCGFLTTDHGQRIGIAGEVITKNGQVCSFSKINSLVIRIPNYIDNCSKIIFDKILNKSLSNILIISPPMYGKTTILKDISINLNKKSLNILIIDERGEFVDINGENIDKLSYISKQYAFLFGIRALNPDIVIMDELMSESEFLHCKNIIRSGVNVIASYHAEDEHTIKNNLNINDIFNYYVILSKDNNNKIKYIIDKNGNVI